MLLAQPLADAASTIHTALQQAQGRQAHYETIGRVLFGLHRIQ